MTAISTFTFSSSWTLKSIAPYRISSYQLHLNIKLTHLDFRVLSCCYWTFNFPDLRHETESHAFPMLLLRVNGLGLIVHRVLTHEEIINELILIYHRILELIVLFHQNIKLLGPFHYNPKPVFQLFASRLLFILGHLCKLTTQWKQISYG